MRLLLLFAVSFSALVAAEVRAAEPQQNPAVNTRKSTAHGDAMLARYFAAETAKLSGNSLSDIKTLQDWEKNRKGYRKELQEMLGLDPMPQRTPLHATVTGKVAGDGFTVEKLHFQSRPGLYVTANLYLPAGADAAAPAKKSPAVLYVCGHGRVKKDGVSYGNKTHYHHHGVWFARNGYVCLAIDTIQLGEIEGVHHGTYGKNRWWWLNRGYTPAGVEAWNCVRALDYLQSRKEVDGDRLGVTGRSGGGAYSWWIAALDERIKAAVPVAGITDLQNHVVDGCIEGHCDCMFMVNTYRWDYAKVAALVAPRPLLISNTDRDRIFPLDGVVRTHAKVRRIYELYGKPQNLALHITAGPHQDTQELRIHAFRWLNHHLKGDNSLISIPADKVLEPEQLKVFKQLPADEKVTSIDESFTVTPTHQPPANAAQWEATKKQWMAALKSKVFRGWPEEPGKLNMKKLSEKVRGEMTVTTYGFSSQPEVDLTMIVERPTHAKKIERVVLKVASHTEWQDLQKELNAPPKPAQKAVSELTPADFPWAVAYLAPRGTGPTAFNPAAKKQIQNRRRYYLLGQTLDGMQVFDTVRAAAALQTLDTLEGAKLKLAGSGRQAIIALYAGLFAPDVQRILLTHPTASHREGPYFLNVSRFLDIPQAVALAASKSTVYISTDEPAAWKYVDDTAAALKWSKTRFQHAAAPAASR